MVVQSSKPLRELFQGQVPSAPSPEMPKSASSYPEMNTGRLLNPQCIAP
nr:MAG TPA: hypothetical protein [Bacteriophage sp.]